MRTDECDRDSAIQRAYQQGFEQGWRQALEQMGRDALTGVKSKHAYTAACERIDAAIAAGEQEPFALVVCDVNKLKHVNDTQGHEAGDRRLKEACALICDTFKHSPVYRFGGDEFVAILTGHDFARRAHLVATLQTQSQEGLNSPILACGIADWDPKTDTKCADVFRQADASMYNDKRGQDSGGNP